MKTNVSTEDIRFYYDGFSQKLLSDYVYGNPRVSAAIAFAVRMTRQCNGRILDIGCGIGQTSASLRRQSMAELVHAVDISSRNIEIAEKLFGGPGLVFEQGDMSHLPHLAPYDAGVLIDVYEHIPRERRPEFQCVLAESLASDGIVVMTGPSVLHQEHLARNNPEGLQVVDETVGLSDLLEFGRQIGAQMTYFELVSIWNTNDYFHTLFQRNPSYEPVGRMRNRVGYVARRLMRRVARYGWKTRARRNRVRQRLGVNV